MFSFVDVKAYQKVQNNLVKIITNKRYFTKENVHTAEMNSAQRGEQVEGLIKNKRRGKMKAGI